LAKKIDGSDDVAFEEVEATEIFEDNSKEF